MVEFLMMVLKAVLFSALTLLALGCIGYVVGYGFYSGKAECGGNKYLLILPEIKVFRKGSGE